MLSYFSSKTPLWLTAHLSLCRRNPHLCFFNISTFLFCILSFSRTFFSKCPSRNYYCRMKCNSDEHAVKYCADWTICCRPKKIPLKKTKW
uniref:Beta-defensin n=1 Tax=Suricata suricatta TaxID=37032 RepID=A0A673U8W3_SURSU